MLRCPTSISHIFKFICAVIVLFVDSTVGTCVVVEVVMRVGVIHEVDQLLQAIPIKARN